MVKMDTTSCEHGKPNNFHLMEVGDRGFKTSQQTSFQDYQGNAGENTNPTPLHSA
jgi:hypothetical protein